MPRKNPLYKPVVLLILDGWGIMPGWSGNAISSARPRHFDYYWRNFPHLVLQAFSKIAPTSGIIPDPAIGHTILGAGRIVYPVPTRISNQIRSGEFFENPKLNKIATASFQSNSNVHLIGLISDAGLLMDMDYLQAMLVFFKNKGVKNVFIHGILDGKDTKPTAGIGTVDKLEQRIAQLNYGQIVDLVGRSWIFDGEATPSKLNKAVNVLFSAKAQTAYSSIGAMKAIYQQRISDSACPPIQITGSSQNPSQTRIKPQDLIVLFNFKGNNLKSFIEKLTPRCKQIYSLTDYKNPKIETIFPDITIENSLSEVLATAGLKQLKVAESLREKQIDFYFNGLSDKKFPGEERLIIQSEKTVDPKEHPELKLYDLIEKVTAKIAGGNDDFILINLANADIVAATEDILACQKAISYIDEALAEIVGQTLKKAGCVIICSDHGNVENVGESFGPTLNPVPFMMINLDNKSEPAHNVFQTVDRGSLISEMMRSEHTLADVAPTILELLGLPKPDQMSGKSLVSVLSAPKPVAR